MVILESWDTAAIAEDGQQRCNTETQDRVTDRSTKVGECQKEFAVRDEKSLTRCGGVKTHNSANEASALKVRPSGHDAIGRRLTHAMSLLFSVPCKRVTLCSVQFTEPEG